MPRTVYHVRQGCKPNPACEQSQSVAYFHRTEILAFVDMFREAVLKVCKLFRV